jgi:hypothetical protein
MNFLSLIKSYENKRITVAICSLMVFIESPQKPRVTKKNMLNHGDFEYLIMKRKYPE